MSSSPRYRRGTSVIAALVFAAILGAVALSLNAMQSNSANTAAMPASLFAGITAVNSLAAAPNTIVTGTPAPTGTPTTPATQAEGNQQTCQQVIDAAAAKGQATQKQTVTDQSTSNNLKDSCNAAVINQSTAPALQQQYPGTWQTMALTYRCVGKSGTLTTNPDGTLTEVLNPDPSLDGGQCMVQNCSASASGTPTKCQAATLTQGVDSSALSAAATSPAGTQAPDVTPDTSLPAACQTGGLGSEACQAALAQAGTAAPNLAADGCAAGAPSGGGSVAGSTSYYCGTAPQAQAQLSQLSSQGVSNCSLIDQYSVTCTNNAPAPVPSPCPTGVTNCTQAPPVAPPAAAPAANNNNGLGSLGNLGSLASLLSGLAKGLTSSASPCTATQQNPYIGGNGTTLVPVQTVNAYGQVQTTYVQQQQTGINSLGQPCTTAQPQTSSQAPYGTGSNGVACNAPPAVPQCATGATAQPTSSQGNGCTDGYQCVPTSSTLGQTPTPQLSCSPQTADVGESIAISFSCQNATGSSGAGFSTNNQISGSASSTIAAPPAGENTANYGLTCTNNGQVASAQCSVQVNQPAIDLVADPQYVQSGATASIGWVTAGMQSCIISSPTDATFTANNSGDQNVNGVAQTDAITQNTQFNLTCQTLGGQTKEASTIVSIGNAISTTATSTGAVSISSTADGQAVNHGDTVTVTWNASTTVSNSAVALWLIDVNSEQATALISGDEPLSGTYQWQLPAVGATCNQNSYATCASDLVAGDPYGIEAAIYTPASAYIGPASSAPAGSVTPTYEYYGYTPNIFTVGQ